MITSFTAKNFRCFRDFTVEPLERFNLIAGRNNSGKTCLLEGLFLYSGAGIPDMAVRLRATRAIAAAATDPDEAWGWVFRNKTVSEPIEVSARGNGTSTYALQVNEITQDAIAAVVPPAARVGAAASSTGDTPTVLPRGLRFRYVPPSAQAVDTFAVIDIYGNLQVKRADLGLAVTMYLTTRSNLDLNDVRTVSRLLEHKRITPFVEALKVVDPRILSLSVLATGAEPTVCADIGHERVMPLPILGEGVVRVLHVLAAIEQAAPGGTVLIDEIENGIHYSVLKDVWSALRHAAREADVQVFATTHSWECIRAAHEAFSEADEYDFRLHRLDRVGEDVIATVYDQETLDAAIDGGIEVR